MTVSDGSEPVIGLIPLHFDVPGHSLPLDTFVQTASHIRGIVDSFNHKVFDNRLRYELLILPPQNGSFITRLGFILLAGWGAVWAFTGSDVGKGFIRGLTKHDPEYWFERLGAETRERILGVDGLKISNTSNDKEKTKFIRKFETNIITESTKSFLRTDQMELKSIQITPREFRHAFEARNEFYKACIAYQEIRAVGFEETTDFSVKRKDFAKLQVALPPKDEQPPDMPWEVEFAVLRVTSPNWDKEDRQRRWKARDSHHNERHFWIEDQHFWALVAAQQLDPHIIDKMKVQWAYVGDNRSRARVLKVLEYNDQVLGEPLNENALRVLLGAYNHRSGDQKDLFGR